ncbi:unnamed protein product [Schistocephalus solidus]|uniref:Peptidase A2 domain-containing protein n=1 Tax=Schistocephalus solidus TaxID=70667 RepID=A0A183TNJ0_SCHSO|nr:unnamed protein product [Schistocephalus solidus]
MPKVQSVGNSLSLLATFQLNSADRRKFVDILLNGYAVCLQLDTASDITIISERLWQSHDAADFLVQHKRVRWSRPANGATAILRVFPRHKHHCDLLRHQVQSQPSWSRLD